MAVDNSSSSSGELYVGEEEGVLKEFTPFGAWLGSFTMPETSAIDAVAVDGSGTASTGRVYVAERPTGIVYELDRLTPGGGGYEIVHELTGLSEPSGLAVDGEGNLYVAQFGAGNVLELSPSGEPLNEGKPVVEGLSEPEGIAVDTRGDLYVADSTAIVKLTRQGAGYSAPSTIVAQGSPGVAVDSSTGDVYFLGQPSCASIGGDGTFSLNELEPSGNIITMQACVQGSAIAIAEDEATKTVYVQASALPVSGQPPTKVWTFAPRPTVLGESATEVSTSSATLAGTVGADSEPTHYYFEYGTTPAYEARTSLQEVSPGVSDVDVGPEELGGLLPNTEYSYRLVAENETGVTEGPGQTFRTAPAAVSTSGPQGGGQEPAQELTQGSSPALATAIGDVAGLAPEQAVASPPRALTDLQKLIKAFKACEKKPRRERAICEKQARRRYGAKPGQRGRQVVKRRKV
jgi:hypothetical protein